MRAVECVESLDFMKNWDTWRKSLHEGVVTAKKFGMSDEEIQNLAMQVGDFLNEKVCPGNPEEELLKEMWDVSSPEERKTIATVLFKLVK